MVEVDTAGVVERPQRPSFGDAPRPPRRVAPPDPSTAIAVTGKVKWFDDVKGFGFVASEDGGKDVFVHISVLGPAGISHLAEGQQVNMRGRRHAQGAGGDFAFALISSRRTWHKRARRDAALVSF